MLRERVCPRQRWNDRICIWRSEFRVNIDRLMCDENKENDFILYDFRIKCRHIVYVRVGLGRIGND